MPPAGEELRIRSLAALARALGRSAPLFRLLEVAAEEAREAMRAATVSISRLVPGTLTVRTIVNVGDLGPDEVRWPDDETYVIDEFAGLQPVESLQAWAWDVTDPACPPSEYALLTSLHKGSSLTTPVVVDGRLWGELYATRHLGEPLFDDLDTAYLEALLAILSGAVSRSLREESLEQLAYRDPLTGLLNRRALDEHAATACTVPAGGAPRTVTAVTIDINRLKLVNDTLGHTAGDQLIQAVARDLQNAYAALTGSLVTRVGGDEFTVLVTGPHPSAVVAISDELCRRTWRFGPGAGVSAGAASVTVSPDSTVTPADLFAAADRAQYVAKRGRLATTVMADDLGPSLPGADEPA
jgi:diguanylate cyclase (GGDEF)-like protein